MKIQHLLILALFTLAFLGSKAQNDLTISGQFSPVPGVVNINLTYTDLGSTYTVNYNTDSMGYFAYNTTVYDSIGTVTLSFNDCNNSIQDLTGVYSLQANSLGLTLDFGVITYCNNSSGGSLANFSGQFINFSNIIDFTITYEYNNVIEEIHGVSDAQGYFSFDSIETTSPPTISFLDCHGVMQTIDAIPVLNLPYPIPYDFGILDFCPSINPISCNASFFLDQNLVIDSFNNIVSVGTVVVINASNPSTAANIVSYTWDFGDGSATYTGLNFLHTYPSNGPYNLCLSILDDAGCSSTYCDSIMVDNSGVLSGKTNSGFSIQMGDGSDITQGPTAINELKNIEKVQLYPNPAKSSVMIIFQAEELEKASLAIYDLTGKLILNEDIQVVNGQNEHNLNLSEFSSGVYLIQIKNNSGSINHKLSIQ
jgi:hypothetical protein